MVMAEIAAKPEPERVYEVKTRNCLKCEESFESSWPGERICKRCKSSDSWRNSSSFEAA
jgi:hypothetical protein